MFNLWEFLSEHIVFKQEHGVAMLTLWAFATHLLDPALSGTGMPATYYAPPLLINAAGSGAGKSATFKHLNGISHKAARYDATPSPAGIIGNLKNPNIRTLMIDEIGTLFRSTAPEITRLTDHLNAAYERDARLPDSDPGDGKGRWEFGAKPGYTTVALAGNNLWVREDYKSRGIWLDLKRDGQPRQQTIPEALQPIWATYREQLHILAGMFAPSVAADITPPNWCHGRAGDVGNAVMRWARPLGGWWSDMAEQHARDLIAQARAESEANMPEDLEILDNLYGVLAGHNWTGGPAPAGSYANNEAARDWMRRRSPDVFGPTGINLTKARFRAMLTAFGIKGGTEPVRKRDVWPTPQRNPVACFSVADALAAAEQEGLTQEIEPSPKTSAHRHILGVTSGNSVSKGGMRAGTPAQPSPPRLDELLLTRLRENRRTPGGEG
jgi:hypothetical protein